MIRITISNGEGEVLDHNELRCPEPKCEGELVQVNPAGMNLAFKCKGCGETYIPQDLGIDGINN